MSVRLEELFTLKSWFFNFAMFLFVVKALHFVNELGFCEIYLQPLSVELDEIHWSYICLAFILLIYKCFFVLLEF